MALSRLCGDDDIIAPLAEREEALRTERGAQNWRLHGWWDSPRSLFKRRWFKFTAEDYGFYNHMPAVEARALLNDDKIWRSYFKVAFDRNPWDRQVSFYHQRYRRRPTPPAFDDFLRFDKRARLNNYDIYSLNGEVCVDFVGRYENLAEDFGRVLREIGVDKQIELPHVKSFTPVRIPYQNYYTDETRDMVGNWYSREISLLGYVF